MIAAQEKAGIFFDDDAAKKAYTDALSQACRSLGIGADVYWEEDATKYETEKKEAETKQQVLDYLDTLTTQEQLNDFWATYSPFYGKDKDFKVAFAKKQTSIK